MSSRIVGPGVFLSGADCARLDGVLARALRDLQMSNGHMPPALLDLGTDIHAAALEFRAEMQAAAGSGTAGFHHGRVLTTFEVSADRLTVEEVSRRIHRSTGYVRRLLRRGDIAGSRTGRRGAWSADEGSVAAWIGDRIQQH